VKKLPLELAESFPKSRSPFMHEPVIPPHTVFSDQADEPAAAVGAIVYEHRKKILSAGFGMRSLPTGGEAASVFWISLESSGVQRSSASIKKTHGDVTCCRAKFLCSE